MDRVATCHCGQLRFACAGPPAKISLCHCTDCQRRTGSLFSVAAFFGRSQTRVAGGTAAHYARPSASGFAVTFHFCRDCGTSLWWEPERLPHLVGVAAGAFADPAFPMPDQAVWCQDAHPWIVLPAAIASHERNPVKTPPRE